jgi:aspartate/methionine/tyrosine aminotransferase
MKLPPFELERFFAKYEFNTNYLLCSSDFETLSIGDLLDSGAAEAFKALKLGYTDYLGTLSLREQIKELYLSINPQQIVVHSGAQEAIFNCMNTLLEAQDNVVVQFPCYQSLFQVADSIGCELRLWESSEEGNWDLDLNTLEGLIDSKTKLIVLNCPHNPTGYVMPQEKFAQLVNLARSKELYIFCDEVYRWSEYNATERLPAVCDVYEKGISLGVMSKSFGLAGLRIGWIACKDTQFLQSLCEMKEYTSICNSAPSEFLATEALKQKNKILENNKNLAQKNLAELGNFFAKYSELFNFSPPKAGCIAFPSVKFCDDSYNFCLQLQETKSVLLLPGRHFDLPETISSKNKFSKKSFAKNFRIGFGRKNMPQALNELAGFTEKFFY